jgi:SPP1 family predicted phage head-tail adaptor
MRAGDLRSFVEIQRPLPIAGATGDAVALDWEHVTWAWAKFEQKSGLEIAQAEQMESRVWWQVTLRHRLDVDATMRLLYRGRILNITAIYNRDERNREQVLTAWEGKGIE